MERNDFFKNVTELVRDKFETGSASVSVEFKEITKTNDTCLHGLIIKDADSNIAPTIYLDGFLERYDDGLMSIDDIVETVIDVYHSNRKSSVDVSFVQNYEQIKSKLIVCLINTNMNSEYLKSHPHKSVLDLSTIYKIKLDDTVGEFGDCSATIAVTDELLSYWNVSIDELDTQAWSNTKRLHPATFKSITEVLSSMISDFDETIADDDMPGLYVLTNDVKTNGACYMVDIDTLSNVANKLSSDIYLIGSSTHESLILRDNDDAINVEALREMVKSVNETEVANEDILSYSVYRFSRETQQLSIA